MSSVSINGKPISCLIFDLDGTLYDSGNGYVDSIRRNLFQFMYDKEMVKLPDSAEEVWRPLFKKYNQSYKGLVRGGFTFDRDEYWRFHRSGVEVLTATTCHPILIYQTELFIY
jgi:phosphoglycolate phosphatase-like HAD superfamily hydrolase